MPVPGSAELVPNHQPQLEALRHQLRQLKSALEALPGALALFDADLQLVLSNLDFHQLFPDTSPGDSAETVLRRGVESGIFEPVALGQARETWLASRLQRLRRGDGSVVEETLRDGRQLEWSAHRSDALGVVTLLSDVSGQRRAEQRLLDALESIQGGVAVWDAQDRLVICNSQYRELFADVPVAVEPGIRLRRLLRSAAASGCYRIAGNPATWLRSYVAQHRSASGFSEQHYADGRIFLVSQRRTAEGGVVALHVDITERKRREQELLRLSRTDSLTGACNRRYFLELARREVRRARRYQNPLSVLVIDLDHFKQVNDRYGHAAGDAALCHFVALARSTLREVDLLGRMGGEEFAVMLPETEADRALHAAERLRTRLSRRPLQWQGQAVALSTSIGVAQVDPGDGEIVASLQRADHALYRAKSRGRNRSELAQEIET